MARIQRKGVIQFLDAKLSLLEDGCDSRDYEERNLWEKQFKREVFSRIIQQLNRIGWKCVIPEDKIKSYGVNFARNYRYCVKGDLQADLELSGRSISLEMFQSINTPNRPDWGGRHESNKEALMPYLMRLEMERTRRKIRDYLCNVFDDYQFKTNSHDGRNERCGFMHLTALQWIEGCYQTNWHFKGDTSSYQIRDSVRLSADNQQLQHGQRVYFFDSKGRINTGIAYYNINNMWWVATGKYSVTNRASFDLLTCCPENYRVKRNDKLRTGRLNQELNKAIKRMDFERAIVLRDVLYPIIKPLEGRLLDGVLHDDMPKVGL